MRPIDSCRFRFAPTDVIKVADLALTSSRESMTKSFTAISRTPHTGSAVHQRLARCTDTKSFQSHHPNFARGLTVARRCPGAPDQTDQGIGPFPELRPRTAWRKAALGVRKRSNSTRGNRSHDRPAATSPPHIAYDDLREWLALAERLGEVQHRARRKLAGGYRARRRGDPARRERPLRRVRRRARLPEGLPPAAQHVRRHSGAT